MSKQNRTLMSIYHLYCMYMHNRYATVPVDLKESIYNSLHIVITDDAKYYSTTCDQMTNLVDSICLIEVPHGNFEKLRLSCRLLPDEKEVLLLPDGRMTFVRFVDEKQRTAIGDHYSLGEEYKIMQDVFDIIDFIRSIFDLDVANIVTRKTEYVARKIYDMSPLYLAFLIVSNHTPEEVVIDKKTWIAIFRKYFTRYIRYTRVRDDYYDSLYSILVDQDDILDSTFDANTIYNIFRSCLNTGLTIDIEV